VSQTSDQKRGLPQRLLALLCFCVLILSIIGLAAAFVIDMNRARHDFDRAATSQEQLATVARIEAALNGGDQGSLAGLLHDYRRSIRLEAAQLDRAGEARAQAVEAARADRLLVLASRPNGAARDQAIRRLVAVISDGERIEATEAASRMEGLRRRTTFLAISLTGLALLSALLGAIGLIAANRRLTGDVAARNRELATIERSRRLFFAKVSHELRTPVTVMRGEAEVALSDPGSDPRLNPTPDPGGQVAPLREALDRVVANAEFLEHRIEELLSLARAENGELQLDAAILDLRQIVEGARQAASAYARSLDVALDFSVPDVPVLVRGDARWLQQALVAILDNGVKFSPIDGTVSLAIESDDATVSIAIGDQGAGIPPGDLPRIFDAYYQTETGRERGGTGLGLALARWIIERHGGTIGAGNAAGGGCVMTIVLPRAP
jgi:signal transduction histidine kinase